VEEPSDPDAEVKGGRPHMMHEAEHAVEADDR
jgi:hypothetical protein